MGFPGHGRAKTSDAVRATEDAVLNVQDMAALDELGAGTWFFAMVRMVYPVVN